MKEDGRWPGPGRLPAAASASISTSTSPIRLWRPSTRVSDLGSSPGVRSIWPGALSRPLRACGKNYRGINCLVLWLAATAKGYGSPYWLTFRQALELGGNVRKGEHGAKVCYFDRITREAVDQNTGEATEQHIPFIKTYTVFSAEQCENLPAHFTAKPAPPPTPEIEEARLAHAEAFIAHTGAEIRYGGDRACYALVADRISMPPFAAFATADMFYSTVLHEMCHWTRR